MALDQAHKDALNAEILGGESPLNAQYLIVLGNGQDNAARADLLADLLNDKTTGRTIVRKTMPGAELLGLTVWTEYAVLSDAKKTQWLTLCSSDTVDTSVGGAGQNVGTQIFPPGGDTAQAIATGRLQTVSRAQELNDLNGLSFPEIKAADVLDAGVFA